MNKRHGSLRTRLTGAVMVPLAALVLIFGSVTWWVTHNTEADTVDRVLVGSVRTLSLVYNSDPADRQHLVPLAIHLLQRRARPVVHYSVYRGHRLLSGDPDLAPPPDYSEREDGVIDRHPPATFKNAYRQTNMVRGYIDPADAASVTQAAYLRNGVLRGKRVRIATEIRRARGEKGLVAIQIADILDDRAAYETSFLKQVVGVGLGVLLLSALLFWWAITWGLRPFSLLTQQVESARHEPSLTFRLAMPDSTPSEAVSFIAAFNGLMTRLEKATESLRQFTANASHQMRTPLALARVNLDVLDRYGPTSAQGRAALADLPHAIDSLEQLLRQLIVLARSEGQGGDAISLFDLADVVAQVTGERAARAPGHIDISYEKDGDGPIEALGQPMLAAQLIGNLLDNAIRYNRENGSVVVRVMAGRDGARVEIEDDGPGIAPADRDKVWERFYRVPGSSATTGSGLGLPIVRALADRIGAHVELNPGRGGRGVLATVLFRAALIA